MKLGILDFEPLLILTGLEPSERQAGLSERYRNRLLVAIAAKADNDDVACWDLDVGDIAIAHDYASPGWEQRGRRYPDFKSWMRAAFDEKAEIWTAILLRN